VITLHLWDYPDSPDGSGGAAAAARPRTSTTRAAPPTRSASRTTRSTGASSSVETSSTRSSEAYLDGDHAEPLRRPATSTVKLPRGPRPSPTRRAAKIATGHYARIGRDPSAQGHARILEAKDARKDQSYFLYATPHSLVEKMLFPLGESHKPEVRAEAVARDLPGATKGESQELCFVGQGDHAYVGLVEERADKARIRPGPIVDADGRVVGRHEGVHRYTVGQRRGLGVAVGKPAFVSRIDPSTGTVTLGDAGDLLAREVDLEDVHLAEGATLPSRARVRIRYRHEGAFGHVLPLGPPGERRARVVLDEPVRAAVRGQIAVFYEGDAVLGGGRIVRVGAEVAP
jgi:tRNA-specific 2-thiouridylase